MIDIEQIRGLSFTMDEHGHRYMIDLIGELCDEIERITAQRNVETDDVKKAHAMGWDDGINDEREAIVGWLRDQFDTDSVREAIDGLERGEHRRTRT